MNHVVLYLCIGTGDVALHHSSAVPPPDTIVVLFECSMIFGLSEINTYIYIKYIDGIGFFSQILEFNLNKSLNNYKNNKYLDSRHLAHKSMNPPFQQDINV